MGKGQKNNIHDMIIMCAFSIEIVVESATI